MSEAIEGRGVAHLPGEKVIPPGRRLVAAIPPPEGEERTLAPGYSVLSTEYSFRRTL